MVGTISTKTVTIEKRGAFHDDSFFKDSWDEWDQAMKDVVKKWDQESPLSVTHSEPSSAGSETRSVYRKIRSSNVSSDESQAVSCTEESDKYKVVIDVKDFKPEDINVKTVDDTVVVEGKVEKKEGNSISTQKFVRRFLLPPGIDLNRISSALSKDGVLTINAPKQVSKLAVTNGKSVPVKREVVSSSTRSYGSLPAAGKPSVRDTHVTDHISRTGTNTAHLMRDVSPKRNTANMPAAGKPTYTTTTTYTPTPTSKNDTSSTSSVQSNINLQSSKPSHVFTMSMPDPEHSSLMNRDMSSFAQEHWSSFNDMVDRSQRDMQEMMKRHTLHTSIDPPPALTKPSNYQMPSTNNIIAIPSDGVKSSKEIFQDGNTLTKREEHRWNDVLVPGINRENRARTESSTIKNSSGDVIGKSDKKQQHSHAEGGHEEILPDGTKVKTFTKNYETKNFYSVNTGSPKAL